MWISRKDYDDFRDTAKALQAELEKLRDRPFVIGIERSGRENIFTFARGSETYQVRTMGLLSDDLPEWKEKLLR